MATWSHKSWRESRSSAGSRRGTSESKRRRPKGLVFRVRTPYRQRPSSWHWGQRSTPARSLAAADEAETPAERSGHWQKMTLEEAVEHLKTWIDLLDDPSQIATLMIHVCGCPRAAVIDGTHIAAELP